jgi:UTP--glucose-1-phosphate uridylyltransferase
MVHNILPQGVACIFVRQPEQLGLGHAVLCAERAVGSEPFAVLLADDFLTFDGDGVTADLVRAFEQSGKVQLSVMRVDGPEIAKYGVIQPGKEPGSVSGLIEKPAAKDAPSNLASIGRYVLPAGVFDFLRDLPPGSDGEIQLADAINQLAMIGRVEAVELRGKRFDCGSVEGYLDAIRYAAASRGEKRTDACADCLRSGSGSVLRPG